MASALAQARQAVNTSLEALSEAQAELLDRTKAAQDAERALSQHQAAWHAERAALVAQLEQARHAGTAGVAHYEGEEAASVGQKGSSGSRAARVVWGSSPILAAPEAETSDELHGTIAALRQEARSREALLQSTCDELSRAQGEVSALRSQLSAAGGSASSGQAHGLRASTPPGVSDEVTRLRDELALERAAAANASRAFADELVTLQSSAEATHRSLEARLESERATAAQLRARCAQASAQAEQLRSEVKDLKQQVTGVDKLRSELERLRTAQAEAVMAAADREADPTDFGMVDHKADASPNGTPRAGLSSPHHPEVAALRAQIAADARLLAELSASRDAIADELATRIEAANGRIGQLQRALASAAHHTAGAEARWAQEKEAMMAQYAAERDRLVTELHNAKDQTASTAAPIIVDAAALAALPEEQRALLVLESDVRVAAMAKQAADAARKLQSVERERRRLADENAQLRETARNSSLLALLGGAEADALLSCAPAAALDDVVTQGQALGALLASRVEAVVYDGVATLAQGTGITYASVEAATNAMAGHLRAAVGDGGLATTAHIEPDNVVPAPYTTRY
jgi:hypothetical protein